MGLLGQSGAGACPNLPQRRPEPGSAADESAEYQRFSFGASVESGSLGQIWTTRAAADPREARRGPLHGRRPRRSPRSRAGPLRPERRDVHFALERALLTAHLECKMHISTSTGPTRPQQPERLPPASPRADSGPRTAAPGEGGLSELGDGVKGSNRTLHRPHDGDAPRGRSGAPADTKEAAQRGARLGHEGAWRS